MNTQPNLSTTVKQQHIVIVILLAITISACGPVTPVAAPPPPPTATNAPPPTPEPTSTAIPRIFYPIEPLSIDVTKFVELERIGHGVIKAVALSPDKKTFALAGGNGIWLYPEGNEETPQHLDGNAGSVHDLAWSPDGNLLASANDNGSIQVWDLKWGKISKTLQKNQEAVRTIAWSPNGLEIAAGGNDNYATIWNVQNGTPGKSLAGFPGGECGSCRAVTDLAWAPDGKKIALVTNAFVKIWTPGQGQSQDLISSWSIAGVAWSPDGKQLGVGTDEGLAIFKTTSWQKTIHSSREWITTFSWSPDDTEIIFWSMGDQLSKWNLASNTYQKETIPSNLSQENRNVVGYAIQWMNPNTVFLANGDFWVWNLQTAPTPFPIIPTNRISRIAASPDGKQLVTSNGLLLQTGDSKGFPLLDITREKVSWAPDGQKIAFFGGGPLAIYDIKEQRIRWRLDEYPEETKTGKHFTFSWSPDGQGFAAQRIVNPKTTEIEFWRLEGEELQQTGIIPLTGSHFLVSDLAWSPDGKLLAFTDDEKLKIYDATSKVLLQENTRYGWCNDLLSWSPSGQYLALQCEKHLVILDSNTWKENKRLPIPSHKYWGMTWSPDEQFIAIGHTNGEIRIWNIQTRKMSVLLTGHTDHINGIIWMPDGRSIVTSSWDGTVRIWGIPHQP